MTGTRQKQTLISCRKAVIRLLDDFTRQGGFYWRIAFEAMQTGPRQLRIAEVAGRFGRIEANGQAGEAGFDLAGFHNAV